ncbi:YnbE family lipoprotein [Sphingomonas crocodyli]|uniref:YnbE family lipoprotein n=1 Tax=Sphingomonas crocodyli TaxID=1979270 RepID=A0A437MAB8_9SPHN|nr:YnbE family lipoprotein [Sphingomonas crocodyli]RVT94582.1 YnbE family lipoprotein [Sphingomonas crocodyli]
MKRTILSMAMLAPLGGCINVTAPEKPIEINLNVNVKQEVVVKLQKDADDFIANNPELFPQ